MSQIQIRPVTAADHAAWLPLWQALSLIHI